MRTTLTLDDDVAIQLEALRRSRGASLKAVVNDILRMGLNEARGTRTPRAPPHLTAPFDAGRVKVASMDNVADVIAVAEGEAFR